MIEEKLMDLQTNKKSNIGIAIEMKIAPGLINLTIFQTL